MATSARGHFRFWAIALAIVALLLWLLGHTLVPFIAGAALAYLLNPLVHRLQRLGLGRVAATALIALLVVLGLVLVTFLILPALVRQLHDLVAAAPNYLHSLSDRLSTRFPDLIRADSPLRHGLAQAESMIQSGGVRILDRLLVSSLALLDLLILFVITPVVAFYLLLDWDRFVAAIDELLPREHAPTIRRLAGEIDHVLSRFVRGQVTVCLILGCYYALGLTLIGLHFGFLVGFIAGCISFIPFVGSISGLVLSVTIATVQFWDSPGWILATAAVFAVGQFSEAEILSPNLVGKSVGLHPVGVLFALAVFGSLFGFAGLLIAVPVAAILTVLGRFALERYRTSELYTGGLPPPGAD